MGKGIPMIQFRLDIVPPKTTSQTKRLVMVAGKPRFFPKREHQEAENDLLLLCRKHAPSEPLRGPLSLSVAFVWPWRSGEPLKHRKFGTIPHDRRPDLDNCVKLICDILTKLCFWTDDGQISELHVRKFWGDRPSITVCVDQCEP